MAVTVAGLLQAAGIDPQVVGGRLGIDPGRVPVRPAPRLLELVWIGDVGAMSLPWGIYVKRDLLARPERLGSLAVHELAHVDQWRRLGVWRFLTRYLGAYLQGRRRGLSHDEAYRDIELERQARRAAEDFFPV